ncbi:MAG: hypothetical protein WCD11_06405 [Solirubrobacteraceae bacterium]
MANQQLDDLRKQRRGVYANLAPFGSPIIRAMQPAAARQDR